MKIILPINDFARFCSLLCLFVANTVFAAQAELQWEKKTIQLDLHPLQLTGTVEFPFTNTGTNSVEIVAVRTTCGCLKAKSSTNRVAVGESGTINVAFNFNGKLGPQRKSIAVRIRDAAPKMLYVQTNIPEVYTLSEKQMVWTAEDRAPKTCRLINRLKEPVLLISAVSSSDSFNVELIPIREGFEYEVRIFPRETATPVMSTITVLTECPPELDVSRSYTFKAVLR